MKKILLVLIIIWLLNLQIAYCSCNVTGGACSIDDLIVKQNQLQKIDKSQKRIQIKPQENKDTLKNDDKVKVQGKEFLKNNINKSSGFN